MKRILVVLVLAASAQNVAAQIPSQAKKLVPTDDATKDPSFLSFRSQLLQALARRDTTYLYSVLAPDIKNTFGGDDSIPGFKRLWKMDQPTTPVWEALTRVLSLGGELKGETFQAPYVFAKWPQSVDAFEFVAIVGELVSVREEPRPDAPKLAALSWDIVTFREWKGLGENGTPTAESWAQIELGSGKTGWVYGRYVYSPVSWRAIFEKREGRWVLTTFIAGD